MEKEGGASLCTPIEAPLAALPAHCSAQRGDRGCTWAAPDRHMSSAPAGVALPIHLPEAAQLDRRARQRHQIATMAPSGQR